MEDNVIDLLAVATSVVELFKKALEIIDGRAKNKREAFERTFKPLYEGMAIIAKEYYAAVHKADSRLQDPAPDYRAILRELETSRAEIVMTRNGIIGQARAHRHEFQTGESQEILNRDRFKQLALAFAESLDCYFSDSEQHMFDDGTAMTGLIISLSALTDPPSKDHLDDPAFEDNMDYHYAISVTPELARSEAQAVLATLERRWIDVSKAYEDLKLFCAS